MLISKFGAADIEGLLEEYEDFIGEEIPDQLRLFLEIGRASCRERV